MSDILKELQRAHDEVCAQHEKLILELASFATKGIANPDWKYVEYLGDVRNKLTKIVEDLKTVK
jgi:hypothetical protein